MPAHEIEMRCRRHLSPQRLRARMEPGCSIANSNEASPQNGRVTIRGRANLRYQAAAVRPLRQLLKPNRRKLASVAATLASKMSRGNAGHRNSITEGHPTVPRSAHVRI